MTDPTTGPDDALRAAGTAPSLGDLIATRYSRRDALRSSASAAAVTMFGGGLLAACSGGGSGGGGMSSDPLPTVATTTSGAASTGAVVRITGTATDNGTVTATTFVQISGPTVTLSATTGLTTTFIAPAVSTATPVVIRFTATDNIGQTSQSDASVSISPAVLSFGAVAKNRLDVVTVPAGHTASVLYRLGDPLNAATAAYQNNGADTGFSARAGDHADAIRFFGLATDGTRDDIASARGLLVMNHENITQAYLHPAGPTSVAGARPEGEALKEIEAHGLSVVDVSQATTGAWSYAQASSFNRRVTPNTAVAINGPASGNALLQTGFSPAGTAGRGTIGNNSNGFTPWGTYLTGEDGWAAYFRRPPAADNARRSAREVATLTRYGVTSDTGQYGWASVTPADPTNTTYRRWDAQATGGSATADYRNEPNQFGWVVEVDPYDPASVPRKRTALGRLAHGGCFTGRFVATVKPAIYLGDAGNNEYLYKFVSSTAWVSADAATTTRLTIGDKYFDAGTLYVAQFAADGTGTWVPLTFGTGGLTATNAAYGFTDQADVLVNARLAGDVVGATRMDRPEWTTINPITGEIYVTLNGNNTRTATNPASPRAYVDPPSTTVGNRNGHVLRLRELADSTEAVTFAWDIYLFGAGSDLDPTNINASALDATNDFSGPEGVAFARPANQAGLLTPVLFLSTDDSAYADVTNAMLLAGIPGTSGDGAVKTITNTVAGATTTQATKQGKVPGATLKRLLVGPVACAVTGVDSTPDGRSLFVNIQHPGLGGTAAAPTSNWPASQATGAAPGSRPRSATIVITRTDGGLVGL